MVLIHLWWSCCFWWRDLCRIRYKSVLVHLFYLWRHWGDKMGRAATIGLGSHLLELLFGARAFLIRDMLYFHPCAAQQDESEIWSFPRILMFEQSWYWWVSGWLGLASGWPHWPLEQAATSIPRAQVTRCWSTSGGQLGPPTHRQCAQLGILGPAAAHLTTLPMQPLSHSISFWFGVPRNN